MKKSVHATLHTAGDGYWSDQARAVRITDLEVAYSNEDQTFGELCVYFDPRDWNVREHGLIYTDRQFQAELRHFLKCLGLPGDDVAYSEQGMQSNSYVSLDCGERFLATWMAYTGEQIKPGYH